MGVEDGVPKQAPCFLPQELCPGVPLYSKPSEKKEIPFSDPDAIILFITIRFILTFSSENCILWRILFLESCIMNA